MRDLKFRAWDKISGKMRHDINDCFDGFVFWSNGKLKVIDTVEQGTHTESRELLIELYTGLKDKNGVEIYEGDICRNGDWESNAHAYNERIEEVCWDKDSACFVGWNLTCDGMTCEVIGNIHENPELLEGK